MNYWSADDVKLIRIFEMSKPVIGAVRGWAMGGGCWMALYTQHYDRHGRCRVRPARSAPWLEYDVHVDPARGIKNALRYGLVGDHVDAQEALRIGLVNKVVPVDQLLEECFNIVERIAHSAARDR